MREHWIQLARHAPLGVIVDLDGTLLPYAPTPDEARPEPALLALLSALADSPGVTLAVASGRSRADLDEIFGPAPHICLFAEHGGWRRRDGQWQRTADAALPSGEETLAPLLDRLAARYPGALVERKEHAVALHGRRVEATVREAFWAEAEACVGRWLQDQPGFGRLRGAEVLEVRPAWMRKSLVVEWLRRRTADDVRILALGDDATDEDMFAALGVADESVRVGSDARRDTEASWTLPGPSDAVALLAWLLAIRQGATPPEVRLPEPQRRVPPERTAPGAGYDFLAISNRLPELRNPSLPTDARRRNVGGLVAALEPALAARRGLWLGWSGRSEPGTRPGEPRLDTGSHPATAWVDFPPDWHDRYYNGFCNRVLWPLLHTFQGRVRFATEDWEAYRRVNEAFAAAAARLVSPDTPVWVHDFHLLLVARALRRLGHRGPIGLFLHVPFPGPDLFEIIPWAQPLMDGMLAFDLLGFHTDRYTENFLRCAWSLAPSQPADGGVTHRGRRVRVGTFPIGILPESFQETTEPEAADDVEGLLASIAPGKLVLGVDRLDYTKGIPERVKAFGHLLERFPEWRELVSLVQISVPSREDVPEYAEQRRQVELAVSRINGDFGGGRWVPVRYLYRSYGRNHLARLYRAAHVGYVTPLRDGMNLVAKEYVAAQDPADPGVLMLSRFAGAAAELRDAVLTNPWHVEGMALDLDRALRMPHEERVERHRRLSRTVERTTALTWARDFIQALEGCR